VKETTMKTFRMCAAAATAALMLTLLARVAAAQVPIVRDAERAYATSIVAADTVPAPAQRMVPAVDEPVEFTERDMSGPRIGFMVATSDGELSRQLAKHDMGRLVSLFGWHFEHRITPVAGGPQFLTEVVPLFGGVEYGKFLPSMTVALGMRMPSGYEFGMGPSFAASGTSNGLSTGLVLSAGKSLDYGGVDLPINLAVSLNSKGTVMSITAGYAIRRYAR
jgi:hypothetical protein